MSEPADGRSAQRVPRLGAPAAGTSLVEAMVALAVLAVAMTVSLGLYDAARKSYAKGENAVEQQQSVRAAFDDLCSSLRMAGFNANPDGDPRRPDEPIEAALDTAIVLRADFDAGDPAEAAAPEEALAAGSPFATVTTGNDEIVAYVLAKPDGSSADTLAFHADLHGPRTGAVARVDVPRVALTQDDPPYTLYRITHGNSGASPVRAPLAENVVSLKFEYYAQDDARVPSPGGSETATDREERARIRRIAVEIVGVARDPVPGGEFRAEDDAGTRTRPRFRLRGDVTPRNLGLLGFPDPLPEVLPPIAAFGGESRGAQGGGTGGLSPLPRGGRR